MLILLRKYLRPEFLNRIDEIIVFHALDREQIREIVGLQLERVRRTASAQGISLEFDQSLIDHLADVGYQPEYGARELRRQIRAQLETQLASAMLRGEISEGDTAKFSYDRSAGGVRWQKVAGAPRKEAAGEDARTSEDQGRGGRGREAPPPAVH